MDGIVYHASKNPNLTELDPTKSKHKGSHGNNYVYAARSKIVATFFSARASDYYILAGGQRNRRRPFYNY